MLTVTIVSSLGAASSQSELGAPDTPIRGAIARYADQQLFGLDYQAHAFEAISLAAALELNRASRARLAKLVVPETGAIPPRLASTIEAQPGARKVHGITVQTFLRRDHASERAWRLSYANGLPRPPRPVRDKLARFDPLLQVGGVGRKASEEGDSSDSIADRLAGRALLRIEIQTPSGWSTVMDTEAVDKVRVSREAYGPPADWRPVVARASIPNGGDAPPSQPGFGGPGPGHAVNANPIWGGGPLSSHPELHVFFWGRTFANPSHGPAVGQLVQSLDRVFEPTYHNRLSIYGIQPGHIADVHVVNDDPPSWAGGQGGNAAAIGAFVLDQGLKGNGPLFWWRVGDRNPIYVIYLPEGAIDPASWTGFHFLNLISSSGLVPFPINLFLNEGMPYMVVKVPQRALDLPTQGLLFRDTCQSIPDLCDTITAFDKATSRASHEYTEATTDPFPFFGYSDPLLQPVWLNGEIADICAHAAPSWGEHTRVGETVLATYWTNRGCWPKSRPDIAILEPTAGASVPWSKGGARVIASAYATDPVDGAMTSRVVRGIAWSLDGSQFASGSAKVTTPPLSLGPHTLTATVTDSQYLTASASVKIGVSAQPPVAIITSPANGASFASDDAIQLRGDGLDYQDGALPEANLVWRVNGVTVGNGRALPTKITSQGVAFVTLTITNSAGLAATAVSMINVGPPAGRPAAKIVAPTDGQQFFDAGDVLFAVDAAEANGSPIADPASIRWTSDVDGVLGIGSRLIARVSGGTCSIFDEQITVSVTGSDAQVRSDTIQIHVGHIC